VTASQSLDVAHACIWGHAFVTMHDWHEVAASGSTTPPTNAPQVSLQEDSQLFAMQTLRAVTVPEDAGYDSKHRAQHVGSPLQAPKHASNGWHAGSPAHFAASAQQLEFAQEAQAFRGRRSEGEGRRVPQ
jgi:hypothetical protein